MKNGLVVTLLIASVALFGVTAGFANAPVIEDIPDVIITNEEDEAIASSMGWTVDVNLFRYENAFNFLDYVSDNDDATTALLWSYVEEDTNDYIQINGKAQSTTPLNPGADELTDGGTNFYASFRDILHSPVGTTSDDLGPFTIAPEDIDGQNRLLFDGTPRRTLFMWVADDYSSASDQVDVYSIKGLDADDLSGGFTTVFEDQTPGTSVFWTYESFSGISACTGARVGDSLSLQAGGTAAVAFLGRWKTVDPGFLTSEIEYVPGNVVYRMRANLSTTQTNSQLVPTFRIGASMSGNTVQVLNTYNSLEGPASAETLAHLPGTGRDYDLFFDNQDHTPNFDELNIEGVLDARTWFVFFDIFDQKNEDLGAILLNDVVVESFVAPSDTTPDVSMTDFTADATNPWNWGLFSGFSAHTNVSIIPDSPSAGKVTFQDLGSSGGAATSFGLWEAQNVLPWTTGLYRMGIELSCPGTYRGSFHAARVRVSSDFFLWNSEFIVNSNFQAQGFPCAPQDSDLGTTVYDHYFSAPNVVSSELESLGLDELNVGFDVYNWVVASQAWGDETTQVTLHRIDVELLQLPM